MRPLLCALLSLALLLAGCAGSSSKGQGSPGSAETTTLAPAPDPVVDGETGSITGIVTDDEVLPIPKVDVGVMRTELRAVTDTGGVFTINDLAPGTYSLFAQALGYESAAKKVDVRAGEVSHANFTLRPVALETEPYYLPLLRTAFINVDQTWVTYVAHDLGRQNTSQVCGSCFYDLEFAKGGLDIMSEFEWKQTGTPSYNDGVHVSVRSGTNDYGNEQFCWRDQGHWNGSGSRGTNLTILSSGKAHFAIQSSFFGVSFQHRVDMWTTIAYRSPLPDEYTAFPPTTEKRQDPTTCSL